MNAKTVIAYLNSLPQGERAMLLSFVAEGEATELAVVRQAKPKAKRAAKPAKRAQKAKPRKCRVCGESGHNSRSCPNATQTEAQE